MRVALQRAHDILVALATNPRLTAGERAGVANFITDAQNAIDRLRADDTIAPAQRVNIVAALRSRAAQGEALDVKYELPAGQLYDAVNLLDDFADVIERGDVGGLSTTLSDGV